jgi:sigma54-dependent transcription regulator
MAAERTYYVSWVALNNDPWPNWECTKEGEPIRLRDGPLWQRPNDDREWPGVPERVRGDHHLIYTGPTLSALFHPGSDYCNLRGLHRAYLLHQPGLDRPDCQPYLAETIQRIVTARKGNGADIKPETIVWVPIDGLQNPTDHEQIMTVLKNWINGRNDPFDLTKARVKKHIRINLSPGTPSMHACWMMLHWSDTFQGSDVQFFQGDGGPFVGNVDDDAKRFPNRSVPFDVLTRYVEDVSPVKGAEPLGGKDQMTLDQLKSAGYQEVRKQIETAALLGLPILLVGERGSGKTFLALHYHSRRQKLRGRWRSEERVEKSKGVREPDSPHGEFVTVTLSEYDQVQELRDTLFGWAKGAFTGATEKNDGLLGRAHKGTLFLDEIHHFEKPLQAALLGPMNRGRYRPKMAAYELISDFDLVVATNDPAWEDRLAEDFCDRIKRIVIQVPSFNEIRRQNPENNDLFDFWEATLERRCRECGVQHKEPPEDCRAELASALKHKPLNGNWRDLHRLADQVLLHLVHDQGGRDRPSLDWKVQGVRTAVGETFP